MVRRGAGQRSRSVREGGRWGSAGGECGVVEIEVVRGQMRSRWWPVNLVGLGKYNAGAQDHGKSPSTKLRPASVEGLEDHLDEAKADLDRKVKCGWEEQQRCSRNCLLLPTNMNRIECLLARIWMFCVLSFLVPWVNNANIFASRQQGGIINSRQSASVASNWTCEP